jgi:hypothetical protein
LEEIESHEGGKPEPIDVDVVGQPEGDQDGDTGEGENDALDVHDGCPYFLETRRVAESRILGTAIVLIKAGQV